MHPIALAYMPGYANAAWMFDLLPFEMWLAVQGRPLDVVIRGRKRRPAGWPEIRAQMKIRAARWHWLYDTPIDDCRVGFDLFASRGISPKLLWSAVGPTPVMRLITTLDFGLPSVMVGTMDNLAGLFAALGRSAPAGFPRGQFRYVPRRGRHDLFVWMNARGGAGVRLLALRTMGAAADFDPDPAVLSALDMKVRRLARLGPLKDGPLPSPAQRTEWADLIHKGQMLAHFSSWLNDAERRQQAGQPIDFALPRLLGLSETAQLRIIP